MLRFQVLWCNAFAQLIYTTIKTTSEFRNVSMTWQKLAWWLGMVDIRLV